jgi:hypothetical protein
MSHFGVDCPTFMADAKPQFASFQQVRTFLVCLPFGFENVSLRTKMSHFLLGGQRLRQEINRRLMNVTCY